MERQAVGFSVIVAPYSMDLVVLGDDRSFWARKLNLLCESLEHVQVQFVPSSHSLFGVVHNFVPVFFFNLTGVHLS